MTIYSSQRPATAEEVYQDICDRITNLQLKPGQKISENQMSEEYGVSRSVIRTRMEVSIDEPLNVDWDGNELLLSDILGTDEDVIYRDLEDETEKQLLLSAISRLTPREQQIVELRYGLQNEEGTEMTQKEVADLMGISQSYISRLEKKIMKRLKKEIVRFE